MDDEIPTDEEVIAVIAERGEIDPQELIARLVGANHSQENVISAIQRVFDRGKVDLSSGLKLSVAHQYDAVAA